MGYFRSVGGSSGGGGLPSELSLNPFPLRFTDDMANGNSIPIIFNYKSVSDVFQRTFTDLKNCRIKGKILGHSDYSSSALQEIDVYCCLFARNDNNILYFYNFTTQSWENSFNGTTYDVTVANSLTFGNARVNSFYTAFRILTTSKNVVPKSNQISLDVDYTINFEDVFAKAQVLGLHFDVEDVSKIICGYYPFSNLTYIPMSSFVIFYGYMVGRQSSYTKYLRFSVDATASTADEADSKDVLLANEPQIKLTY